MRRAAVLGAILSIMSVAGPVAAESSPVPKDPNVVDIAGDANGLSHVDLATPVQIPEADLLAAWFTNDRSTITAHWHLSAAPEKGDSIQLVFDANADPNDPNPEIPRLAHKARCIFFSAAFRINDGQPVDPYTAFTDSCVRGPDLLKWFIGKPVIAELEDGTAIVSATFPRRESPALKGHEILSDVKARTLSFDVIGGQRPAAIRYDSADIGRDYRLR